MKVGKLRGKHFKSTLHCCYNLRFHCDSCRFAGEETLHCFCGAADCRGVVNHVVPDDGQQFLQLRRAEAELISYAEAQKHIAAHGYQIDEFL
jgi:hypothetical protein